jgi:hypothetical protein
VPVDWRNVRELLANPALETIASELEWIEHFARASGAPSAWGRFSIVRELGRGVFGTVYRAVDSSLQIEVALKIIRPRPGVPFDYERAMQEARRLARVRHPAVVRVFAVERIGGEVGLSMELVEGRRSTRSFGIRADSAPARRRSSGWTCVARWPRYTAPGSCTGTSRHTT